MDTDLMAMNLSKLLELVMDREAWHAAVHDVSKSWTRLSNWTELTELTSPALAGGVSLAPPGKPFKGLKAR